MLLPVSTSAEESIRNINLSFDPGLLLSFLIVPLVIGHFWMLFVALRAKQWMWSLAILLLPVSQFLYAAMPSNLTQVKVPLILLLATVILSGVIIAICVASATPINNLDLRMFLRAAVFTLLLPIPL